MTNAAKEQYAELMKALKKGTHAVDGRPVLHYDEYAGEGPQAGKLVVAVQYGGKEGGEGGMLRDYAFDQAALDAPDEEEAEPEKKEEPEKEEEKAAAKKPARG